MGRLNFIVEVSKEQSIQLLNNYEVGSLEQCILLSNGIINSNYKVVTSEGNFLLRIYTKDRDFEGIQFEVSTLNRLFDCQFKAQKPVKNSKNETIGSFQGHYFVLLTFIEGEVLDLENTTQSLCYEVGQNLARMQNLLDGFRPEGQKPQADFDFIDELNVDTYKKLNALGNPGVHEFERIRDDWEALREQFENPGLARGFVHADIYCENTIIENGSLKAFIDFDDSYFGVMLYDLSLVLMEYSILKEGNMNFEFVGAIIKGYTENRSISEVEAGLLFDSMRVLCFKYLSYTSGLKEFSFEALLDNPYLLRLAYFRRDDIRQHFDEAVHRCMTG